MPDVDYSLAAKIAVPQFDPMAVAGKAIALQQGMTGLQQGQLNNRLLQQQVGSKIALGRAVTGATDPATGKTDFDKAAGALAQDPEGAFAVPEFAKAVQERKLAELGISTAELKLSSERWGKIGDSATALLADKDPLTREGVIKHLTDNLVGSGMFNDEHSVGMLTKFIQTLPDDDQGLRKTLTNLGLSASSTQERIGTLLGPVVTTDTGPKIALTQTSPLGGPTAVRGTFDKGLSPSEATSPVTVMAPGPNGTMVPGAITRDQFVDRSAHGAVQTGAPLTAEGVPLATAGSPAYSTKDPTTGQPGMVTNADAARAAAHGGAPAVTPTGPLPGVEHAAEATAGANVAQAQALQQRAAIVPQRKAALSNLMGTLADFTPGPKADLTYQLGALATQFGKAAPSTARGVAAQEEFNKLAAQIALDQWGALGGSGSNEQLATTMKANPTAALSKLGIKNVAALLQGNEDAIGAQFTAWQKYSALHGTQSYGKFLEGWNRYYDPRVFQAQHMEPAAVKVMLSRMTAEERKQFNRDQNIATQAGWLGGK